MDFTTQFVTIYDLLSKDDHDDLRQVLDELGATSTSSVDMEDSCRSSDAGEMVDHVPEDFFTVCRMKMKDDDSSRRSSSVSRKHYSLKVCQ